MTRALLQALPPAAQGLYLRLVLRRGPWFSLQALQYPELPDPLPAAQELITAGAGCKVPLCRALKHFMVQRLPRCSLGHMSCLQQDWMKARCVCSVVYIPIGLQVWYGMAS